ncbi:hypothetical protein CISG_00327 [Coccidioides immitis RMSCC 3703]|nr:hypothetical protein CIRG_07211 [Coccidioides immitis RMSCC 2394]KMU72018.1 hypothetical protein CISG_00327 [Coccidioides immitis RMSCC 3703]
MMSNHLAELSKLNHSTDAQGNFERQAQAQTRSNAVSLQGLISGVAGRNREPVVSALQPFRYKNSFGKLAVERDRTSRESEARNLAAEDEWVPQIRGRFISLVCIALPIGSTFSRCVV